MGWGSRNPPKKKSKASRRRSRSGSSSNSSSRRSPGRGGRANIVLNKQTKPASVGSGEYRSRSSTPQETTLRAPEHRDNITPQSESPGGELGWNGNTVTQNPREDTQAHQYEYSEHDSEGYEADVSNGDAWSLTQLARDGVNAIRGFVEGNMREARPYLPSPKYSQDLKQSETNGVMESPTSSRKFFFFAKNNREESKQKASKSKGVKIKGKSALRMAETRSKTKKGGDADKRDDSGAPPPSDRLPAPPSVGRGGSRRGARGSFHPGASTWDDGKAALPPKTPKKLASGADTGVDGRKPKNPPKEPETPAVKERGTPTQMHPAKPAMAWQRGVLMIGNILPQGMSLNQIQSPPGLTEVPPTPGPPETPAINLVPPSDDSIGSSDPISLDNLTPPEHKDWRNARPGSPPGDPGSELEPIFQCPGCMDSGAMVVVIILTAFFVMAWIVGNKRKEKIVKAARQSRLSKMLESKTATRFLNSLPSTFTDAAGAVRTKLGSLGQLLKPVHEKLPMGERISYDAPTTIGSEEKIESSVPIVDHRAEVLEKLGLPKTASWEDINIHIDNNKTTKSKIRKKTRTCKGTLQDSACGSDDGPKIATTLPPFLRHTKTITYERTSTLIKYRNSVTRDDYRKTMRQVKPEKWGRKDWHLYTRIPSEIFWCPAVDIRECLPAGQNSDAAIASVLAEIERTLGYFGNAVKKQKEFRDNEGGKHTTVAPESQPGLPATTRSSHFITTVKALPAALPGASSLRSWLWAPWELIVITLRAFWALVSYPFKGSVVWKDFVVRLGLAGGFIRQRYRQFLVIHGISPEIDILNGLEALAKSLSNQVLQYWFPPLGYYIGDHFFNTHFPGKVTIIIRAVVWYQLSTAQLLVVLAWPAAIVLRILHPFLKFSSPTYRKYCQQHQRLRGHGGGTDAKILYAMRQTINHVVAWMDLIFAEQVGGLLWRGGNLVPGQWLLKWLAFRIWDFVWDAGRWWLSVPILMMDLVTLVTSESFETYDLLYGLGRVWQEFFKPPIMLVVRIIFIAKVTFVAIWFCLFGGLGYIWQSLRRLVFASGRRGRGSGPPVSPSTPRGTKGYPRLTPGGGGFVTPGGTRNPVPFTIDKKLLQSERRIEKSLAVKLKYEEQIRRLRVMAAEARYNIEVLNRKLRDPSISAARRSEAREQISDFEKRLAVLKISMALNAHRRKEALEEYQRSTHQYDQDQLIFNEAVGGTNKYTSGTFRGETEFKDLAPAEASAAIERNMRAMGIQMRVPKPLPTVTEEPLLTSTTVHQEIETTNTATAAEPRPNEAGNGLTVAGTEGTGTTAAVAVPPTIATPETSLRRSSPGRHGPVEVVVETPLLQDPLRSGVHVVATAPPVHEIRTPPEPVATKTLAEPIKVIALSHIKGPVAEALEDIVGEQIVEAAPEVIEEALRDQIVVNAPAAIAEPVPRPAPAEDIPAMAPDNVLPAPTNNNNLEPVVHVLPEPVAIREPERGVASANKEETARAREPRPAPAGTTVPELVGDNSAEEDARIPRAGLGGNPAEQPNVPVVREQRRTEQPLNPAPEPTVTRTEPRSEGIIASNPATTPTVESRRTEQVTSTGQPKIPENADDESIDTLPPASAIPGLTNIGPGPSGVPASAPSPSNRRPGDQSTVHEFFDTRAPGTTTGGRRPPTDILPSFPLETGRPGSLSNTTQPSAATGIRPPSFKTYCEDQSLPNSNTQGSRIPQLENREASNRRRRRRPASPPKTTTEVRPQPHTTLQTGEELPPVHRNPKHSTERTCDIPPLATTASTSPGSGRISFPNFDFGQPSGSLSRGSNLNRVGVTHVPSAPSPPAAGGSPSKSRMSLMDRFSPSGFGWGDRRQTGNPTTTGSLPVSQQSPPQPPGTLIPSASRALVQNPPTTGSSSVPAPPTPVRPSSSPTSGRASRLPLPSTTTQPRTPEHLKPSSSMASSPGARK